MQAAMRVLEVYDEAIRRRLEPPAPGWVVEQAGPVIRAISPPGTPPGGMIQWSRLDAETADRAIAEQVAYFAGLGRGFEWKLYGHDAPADLGERLARAGFVAQPVETLVVGDVGEVLRRCEGAGVPPGIRLRALAGADDFLAVARLQDAVWGGDHGWLAGELTAEQAADPRGVSLYLAEADTAEGTEVACAAWVRFHAGTPFASLWGGSTLARWRRRGIYRALVELRAGEAAARGFRYLQVDASDDSLPILQRLGLQALTTTTPYVWTPQETSG